MAYTFSGIFADGDDRVLADLCRLNTGSGRMLDAPFRGIGFAFINEYDFGDPETPESLGLLEWSKQHSEVTFVYTWVECEGGDCVYAGFVFRDGVVIHKESIVTQSGPREMFVQPLRRLLRFLSVELDRRGFFEPLTRNFFTRQSAS